MSFLTMFHQVVFSLLFTVTFLPKASPKLLCYECWTPGHNHYPKYNTWANCSKKWILRECVGYYKADECISVAFHDEKFEVKSCLMPELYKYKIMCQVEKKHKERHCHVCEAHFCNKEESKWVPKAVISLISLLHLFVLG